MREKPYYTLMKPGELEEEGGERRGRGKRGKEIKKTEPERQRKRRRYKRV